MPIGRDAIEHDLKTWPDFFRVILTGEKRFEMRKDDRGFQAGDTLLLREWSKAAGYSGRIVRAEVLYLLGGQWPGLEAGYVVMSINVFDAIDNYHADQ